MRSSAVEQMDSLGARTFDDLLAACAAARLRRVNVAMLPNHERLGRAKEFAAAVARVRDRAHAG